jgi:hypothetical protein
MCSGPCLAGHFCDLGSTTPDRDSCGAPEVFCEEVCCCCAAAAWWRHGGGVVVVVVVVAVAVVVVVVVVEVVVVAAAAAFHRSYRSRVPRVLFRPFPWRML